MDGDNVGSNTLDTPPPNERIKHNFRGFCSAMLDGHSEDQDSENYQIRALRSPSPPLTQLEKELQAAGIYFRRPDNSKPKLEDEDVEVAAAIRELDSSIADFSGTSSESSPTRSHASSVVERSTISNSCELDSHILDDESANENKDKKVPSIIGYQRISSPSVLSFSNNTQTLSLSLRRKSTSPERKHELSSVRSQSLRGNSKSGVTQVSGIRTVISVGGSENESSPVKAKDSTMENLNLIEEVYIDSRSAPPSTVSMRAYYPGVDFEGRQSPSQERNPLGGDSDSGHESGATSPCGTLTGEDAVTPPSSPGLKHLQTSQTSQSTDRVTPKVPPRTSSLSSCSTTVPVAHPRTVSSSTVNIVHSKDSSFSSHTNTGSMAEGCSSRPTSPIVSSYEKESSLNPDVEVAVVANTEENTADISITSLDPRPPSHFVVVAIDFGTTYSGYAFSFTRDPDSVHMMKKWEGKYIKNL